MLRKDKKTEMVISRKKLYIRRIANIRNVNRVGQSKEKESSYFLSSFFLLFVPTSG